MSKSVMESGLAALIASSHPHSRTPRSATGVLPDTAKTAIDEAADELLKRVRPWAIAGIAVTIIGTGLSVWFATRKR